MAKQSGSGWLWVIGGVGALALLGSNGNRTSSANEAAPWLNDPVVYPAESVEAAAEPEVGRDLLAAQPTYGDYLPDAADSREATDDEAVASDDTSPAPAPPLGSLSLADRSDDDSLTDDDAADADDALASRADAPLAPVSVRSSPSSLASSAYDPPAPVRYGCAENGSCYGDISAATLRPKTVHVNGYYRKDGTYVRGHYRSRPRY